MNFRHFAGEDLIYCQSMRERRLHVRSWNFKHITNAHTIPLVERICRENGYACPCICTPQMLQEGGRE